MEKMVNDSSVRKVIVICDRVYEEKADGRMGGVGTETQIISQKLYEQVDPTDQKQKFVAVIAETNDKGEPYRPTFMKNRIYIDMADSVLRTENFEQLLRWLFDEPLYRRPDRGKPPAYLFEEKVSLGTSSRYLQAIEAVRQNKPASTAICQEYFETFANNLETMRIVSEPGKHFDDQVVENIESFLPYRDEVTNLIMAIGRYRLDLEMIGVVRNFLEQVLPYCYRPSGRSPWSEWEADNFKFILYELFVYMIAALLKKGTFEGVNGLLSQEYYFRSQSLEGLDSKMLPFTYFNNSVQSLQRRNERLNLSRRSLMADLVKERAKRPDLSFTDIMQADFVLYLRAELQPSMEVFFRSGWWPYTLLYASFEHPVFEIFARAQSEEYFNRMKTILGVDMKEDLGNLIEEYVSGKRDIPKWESQINIMTLMNFERLATKP